MRSRCLVSRTILPAALVALILLAPPLEPTSAKSRSGGISISPREAGRAAKFWTAARMRRARPVELHRRRGGRETRGPRRLGRGSPVRIAARPAARASASTAFEPVTDPTAPGARVNGVVFFEVLFGYGRCSATSVNGPNLSLVVTAGHCVNDGLLGFWYDSNWVFVPGYRHGQRPFGVFPARWLGATAGWLKSGSETTDVGIAVVGRNERGQRLGRAVGGAGIAWNLSPNQVFDIHGYPVERPFGGKVQRRCAQTPFIGHDPESFFFQAGPLTLGARCRLSGGASGGGWTIRDGVLNSVTSYGYADDPGTVFGPYFGREVARLYRQAAKIR